MAQAYFMSPPRSSRPTSRLIIILLFLAGLGLTWVLSHMVGAELAFEREALPAEGQVIALKESLSIGRLQTPVYAPVFRFTTATGQSIEAVAGDASNRPLWQVGEIGQLLYDPAHPTRAIVRTFWGRWGASLVLALVTASFFAASILGLRTRRWRLF